MTQQSENDTDDTEAAVEIEDASDKATIRERLPTDIEDALTDTAFSPGRMRKLLRDTYYLGPIGIGAGGVRRVFGSGKAGTEMRRPGGALYNFPRSWRFAALERGLKTGLITHVGNGQFAATERGVALLERIDECPDCGVQRQPHMKHSVYVGNPNTEGHIESHELLTACPECGANGYSRGSQQGGVGYERFERDEEALERAQERIADTPEARTYGGDREVDPAAAEAAPNVDEEQIDDVLAEWVENHTEPTVRDVFGDERESYTDLYDRDVETVDADGEYAMFHGDEETVVATRSDEEGDCHIIPRVRGDTDDERLVVKMSYDVAVKQGAKDALKPRTGEWDGEKWHINAHRLGENISALTGGYFGDDLTVTVTPEAVDLTVSGLPGGVE
jgi:hypothetical protein